MQPHPNHEFMSQCYLDSFLRGVLPDATPIAYQVSLPKIGSHLITPRIVYEHHGIYIGDEKVIHYSGLADKEQIINPIKATLPNKNNFKIEIVSLDEFRQGNRFEIKLHQETSFSGREIVDRAKERLGESQYSLLFNNCEHFVCYCIDNISVSHQVDGVLQFAKNVGLNVAKRTNTAASIGASVAGIVKYLRAYIHGDISKNKLFEEVSHTAVRATSSFYYAGLGQIAIPVPFLGALVGATVGFFVGDILHKSGLLALGDSYLVKGAKERRQEIEQLCNNLIPEIKRSRQQLELFIDKYLADRRDKFEVSFAQLDSASLAWNPNGYATALEAINEGFGESLHYKTFEDFDSFMSSGDSMAF